MKRILLWLLTAFFFSSNAQFEKNVVMLGVGGNYWKNKSEKEQESAISSTTSEMANIRISAGKFIFDNHLLGAIVNYKSSHFNQSEVYETFQTYYTNSTVKLGVGLLYRYYFTLKDSHFSIFTQAEALYTMADSEESSSSYSPEILSSGKGINAAFRPGLVYSINKKFAVEATFGAFGYEIINYTSEQNGVKEESSTSSVNAGFSLSSLLFGISFYLGGKQDRAK